MTTRKQLGHQKILRGWGLSSVTTGVPHYRSTIISCPRMTWQLWSGQISFQLQLKNCYSNHSKLQHLTWRMLKAPSLKFLNLHISVIKCYCRTYDDNIGPKYLSGIQHHCQPFFIGHIPLSTFLFILEHFQTHFRTY